MVNKSLVFSIIIVFIFACKAQNSHYLLTENKFSQDDIKEKRGKITKLDDSLFKYEKFSYNDSILNYRILEPVSVEAGKKYPLVIIFPHSGGIGNDNKNQITTLPKYWLQEKVRKKYPAYVIAIQYSMRSSNYFFDESKLMYSVPNDYCLDATSELIKSLTTKLNVDKKRVYGIGFSMGSSTLYNLLTRHPDIFKASVSISGIPDKDFGKKAAKSPIWIIHGNADTENPIEPDRKLVKYLQKMNNKNYTYWEISGLEHTVYPDLYDTDMIPEWLFNSK
ncbi:dienelactone hydrolase family protein [Flavobacterium soyae]|uniref:carboxylesterase family protein n=1 Tax=Flavobacterium soyae TaxID=2903098 RepID=UPI001E65ACF8|nr:dienelactone hydrolase family protein [Flavobacterium soyae]MCD9574041.1 dienelactone hydrolase family protein [Flavobacterium soyae]